MSGPAKKDIRIGVFICHCGKNIGGYLDVPGVVKYAEGLPNVTFASDNLYTCSEDGLQAIKQAVKEQGLNRVIVASCTPRTHAPLFQGACEEAGLNKYLFEFVNIRDQCSWVHMKDWEGATQKAKDLIRMGVARAALLEPLNENEIPVTPVAMVIGGGMAGLVTAQNFAKQGIEVHLVEKERELGGRLRELDVLFPTNDKADRILTKLVSGVSKDPLVKLHLGTEVRGVSGYIGNFDVKLTDDDVKVGAIVVATGADVFKPEGMYKYGAFPNVVTQLEFERLLGQGKSLPKKVVMIQCVGARTQEGKGVSYCSKICCMTAIKNARELMAMDPTAEVHVLHRDINTPGTLYERYYHDAKWSWIKFVRFDPSEPPEVLGEQRATAVKVKHETLGKVYEIPVDMVVLSTPLIANPTNKALSQMLKVPTDKDGFFLEAHVKLRPLDFATDGIYLCGTAKFPGDIRDSVSEAYGAAAKAVIPLFKGSVKGEATVAVVDPSLCVGCGTCEAVCEYGAPSMMETEAGTFVSLINEVLCKGCGTCIPSCPSRAIKQWGFTDVQLVSQVLEAADSTIPEEEPVIVGFCCNWCSYAGADMAGVSRFQYPPNMRIVRTMCSGRVDPIWIVRALMEGVDGVFVSGCHIGDCHYITGNNYTLERVKRLKETIADYGIDPRRVRLEWISASEGNRFAELVTEFTNEIKALGPNPLRKYKERRCAIVEEA